MKKSLITCIEIVAVLLCLNGGQLANAEEKNSLTLINHSGDNALVKLTGPSRKTVQIPNGTSKTVNIDSGQYMIYVRYGKLDRYRYTKGESFQIEETSFSYTRATLTLHGVVNGNYHTEGSSEYEFNRQ